MVPAASPSLGTQGANVCRQQPWEHVRPSLNQVHSGTSLRRFLRWGTKFGRVQRAYPERAQGKHPETTLKLPENTLKAPSNQEDINGEKLTVKKWWIFGADFFTVYAEVFTVYKGEKTSCY